MKNKRLEERRKRIPQSERDEFERKFNSTGIIAEHYCNICGDSDSEPIKCTQQANCLNISLANEQKIKSK